MSRTFKKDGTFTEAAEQEIIFNWAAYIPELKYMYAVPNGGSRNRLEAANLKLQGVKSGVPDICLPLPIGRYSGLYIELKTKGNKASTAQNEYIEYLNRVGYAAKICVGADEAIDVIQNYINQKGEFAEGEGYDNRKSD